MFRAGTAAGCIGGLTLLLGGGAVAEGLDETRLQVAASPRLPFSATEFSARPPSSGWESGTISWLAVGADGLVYEIQRGTKADTVLVLDAEGKVVRSWGRRHRGIPHSIRIDPVGNVWTADASLSIVTKYSPRGAVLLTIRVGEQPRSSDAFDGTTDIAFTPDGHLLIADGYGNARILEYSAEGKRLRQWGRAGTGPGEFNLPHSVQVAADGTVYVADRENGRIEKFDRDGKFLGEFPHLGRVYSIRLVGEALWASAQPLDEVGGSAGWIVELDRTSGAILGHIDVASPLALHSIEVSPLGEPITTDGNHLLWFRHE